MKYLNEGQFEKENVFGKGAPNDAYARYFIGRSYLNPLTAPEAGILLSNVTFEPGCRNNWHIHRAQSGGGQIIICTAGEGWYQEEGKPAVSLVPGTVIAIGANVKHWHGAKRIPGSATLPWKFRAKAPRRSGWSRWTARPMKNWNAGRDG